MDTNSVIVERIFNAHIDTVWSALTDKDKMKEWYFDFDDFKPEAGFEFTTYAGSDEKKYLHLFQITEAAPDKKLSYSWKYNGYPGMSYLTFELFPEGDKTKLKLTHTGLESFKDNGPDFQVASFTAGWDHIINTSLTEFVER